MAFCVEDVDSGTPLGHIGVNRIDRAMSRAVVGYWVLPEARGQGVATRHADGHEVSCKVAERCGYRYEGTLRGAMWEAGRRDAFRDCHLHARLATDPEPAGASS